MIFMLTENLCFKIIVVQLIFICSSFTFKDSLGIDLLIKEKNESSIQIDWVPADTTVFNNNVSSFKYDQERDNENKRKTDRIYYSTAKKNSDNAPIVVSSFWANLSIIIVLLFFTCSMMLFFMFRSRKVTQKKFRNRLRAFRNHTMTLPSVVYSYKLETEDPLALLFRRIINGFENDKIHKDPKMSIELFAEQINSYPRYIEAATKVYANCEFYHLLHFYRINEIINTLKYQESNCQNEEELLQISGYRTTEELNMHFKSFMEVDLKYYRNFLFKKIK